MTETAETATGAPERDDERANQDHLADVEVGAGCTEIWEHLSEGRAGASDD
ncbi:hypothetical protein HLRTI_000312 [Halorhabdus tiamatea SARL4B]|uniref:Uncharacterized protein n=1 Tax=Halorhabdus tiamatea SARL4B TaxID=1033806 RepID=F7PK31_9EURY|nr:hypothetical protein [Halorhabdus tiamatea]ERJ07564.1 hypothetical protein HLRTI_000312 [Halorhabdus tiamatea SARL4B]CCQ33487.1 hypothetical protein HTIA_1354 [Halorhabdus tiamatea SARL4B]